MRKQLEGLNKKYREDLIKAFDTVVNLSNETKDILTPEVKQGVLYSEEQLYANLLVSSTIQAVNLLGGMLEQLEHSVDETIDLVKNKMEYDPKELNEKTKQSIIHETMATMCPEQQAMLEVMAMLNSVIK